jgi:hypothetical protein
VSQLPLHGPHFRLQHKFSVAENVKSLCALMTS